MSSAEDTGIRASLKELAEVSQDLDRHSQMAKTAVHPIQAQQVRKRIDELTIQQKSLMDRLVAQHTNQDTKSKFEKLSTELDELRAKIRACDDKEELKSLAEEIDTLVDRWVHSFQVIVSELSGIAPPSAPVYDKK